MMKRILVLMGACLVAGFGQELLVNGDFEQELSVGWTQTYGGSGTHTINRGTGYHPDPDYEGYTYQYDNPGWARLGQTVDVPGVQLLLSFWAKFEQSGQTSCWPAACFCVCYYNASNGLLGETRYYYSSVTAWNPTSTLHPIRITSPDWTEYNLDIADELDQYLPGVNPAQVARVEAALYSYTYSG